jgi:hypothetical protein
MRTTKCASCGSEELLRDARLFKRGGFSPGEISLDARPSARYATGEWSDVRALICMECGHIQLQATDFAVLRAAYQKQRATPSHEA